MSAGWDDERLARACLTAVCEAATAPLAAKVAEVGARRVWEVIRAGGEQSRWSVRAQTLDPAALVGLAEEHGVRFVVPGDPQWPQQVEVLDSCQVAGMGGAPFGLWLRGPGNLTQWSERSVAVVGSRACTQYGDQVASEISMDLASGEPGWTVVSGGAYGIDASAHRGAMAVDGRTVGVLASGLDEPYPRGNHVLFDRMVGEQVLVSEVPCGMHATRQGFLARNRLIAALTLGAVVVEAAARSGANNTASWAAECGRQVMAVPGSVRSSLSTTPHRLIRDGKATLVSDARDVLALVSPLASAPMLPIGGAERVLDRLEPALMAVREVLPARGAMPVGEVARRAGTGLAAALASLAELEQLGLARRDETGGWRIQVPAV